MCFVVHSQRDCHTDTASFCAIIFPCLNQRTAAAKLSLRHIIQLVHIRLHGLIPRLGGRLSNCCVIGRIHQNCFVLRERYQMRRLIIRADQKLLLHLIKRHINTAHAEKLALRIPQRRNDADHHNVISHQLIHIRVHNIRFPALFDLLPVLFIIIIKGIFMLLKNISCLFLIRIHNCLIRHIFFVHTVRHTVGIRNGILLKIGKCGRKSIAVLQKPHQSGINRPSLLSWIQCGNISERARKADHFSIRLLNITHQQKSIFISNC